MFWSFGVNADDPVDRGVTLSQLLTNYALKLWIFENKTHFCAVEGNIAMPLEGQMEEVSLFCLQKQSSKVFHAEKNIECISDK